MRGTTRAALVFALLGIGAANLATAQTGPAGGPGGPILDVQGADIQFDPDSGYFYTTTTIVGGKPYTDVINIKADTLGISTALGFPFGVQYRSVLTCSPDPKQTDFLWATSSGLVAYTRSGYTALVPDANITALFKCHSSALPDLGDVFFAADANFIYVIHSGPKGCFDNVEIIEKKGTPSGTGGLLKTLFYDCAPKEKSTSRTAQADASGTLLLGYGGAGVYRSTDGGRTFSAANTGLAASNNYAWVFVRSGGTLLQGTNQGIYASSDNGSTWTAANNGIPGCWRQPRIPEHQNTTYARNGILGFSCQNAIPGSTLGIALASVARLARRLMSLPSAFKSSNHNS